MNRRCIYLILLLLPLLGQTQNEPVFDQYRFNQLVLNPAYAGSQGTLEGTAMARRQWVGLEDAPGTESVILHAQLANGKIGLGGKLLHDQIGPTEKTTYALDYAYRMYMGSGTLAVGLELSAANYRLNYTQLDAYQDGDPAFTGVPGQLMSYNAGLGVWFNSKRFYSGLSVPNVVSKADENDPLAPVLNELDPYIQTIHAYWTGGYMLQLSRNVALLPHGMVRYDLHAPIVYEGGLELLFREQVQLGAAWQSVEALTIKGEFFLDLNNTLSDRALGVGYAYNQRLDETQPVFGSTHEVFITLQWNKRATRFVSPRFF
ncbi:MAG: type IX secretion system membrane protein PorP/SprF [Chitinophagales bacterium]|nr:type IX secretion system membrane protein PorP/SprF [Chitinophagales bacterium]HAE14902.1 hypothetical protein [Bacteroidota bacterium]MCB9018820.1 type IX secretion system membrane protein PorP/SprF [Chitinophagales bacterium]MCB9020883.1 type IX secretion system membrane protein PorP/SprF [Chitinophagales bacterium]HAE35318.1 hypothetical protein [Bacteroidota bacterium]